VRSMWSGIPRRCLKIAEAIDWPTQRERVVAAARGIYRGQPAGVPTWAGYNKAVRLDVAVFLEWMRVV